MATTFAEAGAVGQADGVRADDLAPPASSTARCMVFSSSRTLPGQGCAQQRRSRASAESGAAADAVGLGVFVDEVIGQRGDVAGALAQRRELAGSRR